MNENLQCLTLCCCQYQQAQDACNQRWNRAWQGYTFLSTATEENKLHSMSPRQDWRAPCKVCSACVYLSLHVSSDTAWQAACWWVTCQRCVLSHTVLMQVARKTQVLHSRSSSRVALHRCVSIMSCLASVCVCVGGGGEPAWRLGQVAHPMCVWAVCLDDIVS